MSPGQDAAQVVERMGLAAVLVGEHLRVFDRPVHDVDPGDAAVAEGGDRQLSHLAGADDDQLFLGEVLEDLLREPRGDGGHGDVLLAERGRRVDPLGDRERLLKSPPKTRPVAPRLGGDKRLTSR